MFLTAQDGFLGPFAWVLGKILDIIYNLLAGGDGIANLAACIAIFTIVVKLLLFPLSFKQQKSSKINMLIQPEIQKIQNKYKNRKDQDSMVKQNQEIQAVYDKYGTSMTGGCLTMLIQLPIMYALWRVIQNIPAYVSNIKAMYAPIAEGIMSTQGDNVKKFLTDFIEKNDITSTAVAMKDLEKVSEIEINNIIDVLSNMGISNISNLVEEIGMSSALSSNIADITEVYSFTLGINISEAPGYHLTWALLIPIIAMAFNYLQMKVSQSGTDTSGSDATAGMMKSMMVTMPIMSFFMCITLPVALGIYWIMGSVFAIATQLIINAYYNSVDKEQLLAKQIEKADAKRAKNGGKKSFMQRMMDASQQAQEEYEKQEALRKNAATSLKNYVPSETSKRAVENKQGKQYKEGSIGSKANIMMNYNKREEN